jgi:phage terminase small subunit
VGLRGPKPASEEERREKALGRYVVPGRPRGRQDVIGCEKFRPPGPLGSRGQRIWRELRLQLARAGVLREGHARKLWLLCGALEKIEEVREFARSAEQQSGHALIGVVWRAKSGYPMRAPWFDAEMKLCELASRLLSEFGLGGGDAAAAAAADDAEAMLGGWKRYAASKIAILGAGRVPDTARM